MRRNVLCVGLSVLLVGGSGPLVTERLVVPQTLAQEAAVAETPVKEPGVRKAKKRERNNPFAGKNLAYPVFGIDEVLDHLATTGSRLHRAGKTKGDTELRQQLGRKTCELTLPAAATDPIPDRELYRRACESVFIVCSLYKGEGRDDWESSLATAFVVTEDGVLSSSCHVFDNEDTADAVVVMDVKKNVYPVTELLAANKLTDTCLFRIDAKNLKPLPLAEDAPPGTPARVVGHPGDSFYFFSTGIVSNYERDGDNIVWMNVTADFGQGSSGGPVFDETGRVIGQVSRTFTLYAGGEEARGRPRRVAGDAKLVDLQEINKKKPAEGAVPPADEIMDPQMVFKSCVPVQSIRALVKPKPVTTITKE